MALNFLISFFSIALMALLVSVNFRIGKFLNLSLGGLFAAGGYIAYFTSNPVIAVLSGLAFGFLLYIAISGICRSVIEATVLSLGAGILIERGLEIVHSSSYYYFVSFDYTNYLIVLGAVSYLAVFAAYISPAGLKIKFIESDHELAEMYGVNTKGVFSAATSLTSACAVLAGFFVSGSLAISPTTGFGYLISGIIVSAISAQLRQIGAVHYATLLAVSLAIAGLLEVLF